MERRGPYAIFNKETSSRAPSGGISTPMRLFLCAVLATVAPLLAQVTINGYPTREFGQPTLATQLESSAPNLVEGRELFSPSGIAFDNSVSPPHVYIVDSGNNRVLAWNNANNVTQGNYADLVIGQPDKYSTFAGGPLYGTSTGLSAPTGIVVDKPMEMCTYPIPTTTGFCASRPLLSSRAEILSSIW